jgi:succinyl-CoA synthetase beta subunit
MKIHEYQGKGVLRRFDVPVPRGGAASTPDEAVAAAAELGGSLWVVKSQIHAGGRGKGRFIGEVSDADIAAAAEGHPNDGPGGVRLARSVADVRAAATAMLGNVLVTKQTGAQGKRVNTVYVEEGCDIAREIYLAVLLDRSVSRVLVMASTAGGTEIEDAAEDDPDAIKKIWIDPATGLGAWQGRKLAFALGIEGKAVRGFTRFVQRLYTCYVEMDCSMLEINPLVITGSGGVIALDCKMSFDDNALYRHPDVVELRDLSEEDAAEVEAGEHNLSFVNLDGNIGCLVNGAGLAMATMDIIQFKGGEPANFLDVGGGATAEQVTAAFRIITRDPKVTAILVNIFGGIMKCDIIAEGVLQAVNEIGLDLPLVVRLAGTNVEKGKAILAESGLDIIAADSLNEAAEAAVAAAGA